MTYTSLRFLIFTLICLTAYYLFPKKHRWCVLLLASIGFYAIVCLKYIAFIFLTAASTYGGGIMLSNYIDKRSALFKELKKTFTKEQKDTFKKTTTKTKKLIAAGILVLNFGILAFLKYYNMFALTFGGPALKLFLPLGISFYTFQSMGYVIDIYRGKYKAEKNFFRLLLFVSFFPQIVQGPISFYSSLSCQLYEGHDLSFFNIKKGVLLITWGFFKKLVIADRLVVAVNTIAPDYINYSGTLILSAALIYALQLYADFSGGIDISRGVSELFGIELAENFRRPYFSRTISEYWRRWHITLGAWLKEYLFYPIAMSKLFMNFSKFLKKHGNAKAAKVLPVSIASLITFIIIGIWHGANWKYAAFGIWNGGIIMVSTLLEDSFEHFKAKLKIKNENPLFIAFQMLRTFFIVLVGYYFDIANDFSSAMKMMLLSVADFHISETAKLDFFRELMASRREMAIVFMAVIVMLVVSLIQEKKKDTTVREMIISRGFIVEAAVFVVLFFSVVVFGVYGPGTNPADFYYMQF